jgi:hypothetical protein
LLDAALGQRQAASKAWITWSASHRVADLSLGERRLLPLIDHNLRAEAEGVGIGDAAGTALVEMWCETQLLFHETGALLGALHHAGIDTLLLKGAALAVLDYPDPMLRPMSDVDVLVRESDATRALAVMRSAHWTSAAAPVDLVMRFQHATVLTNERGGSVDLHWRMLWKGRQPLDGDDEFWTRSLPMNFADMATRALSAEDRLLHVCVHGLEWNPMLPIRWVADAAMIIRRHGAVLDWDLLVARAGSRRLSLPTADALTYLRDHHQLQIPDVTIDRLRGSPASAVTRISERS